MRYAQIEIDSIVDSVNVTYSEERINQVADLIGFFSKSRTGDVLVHPMVLVPGPVEDGKLMYEIVAGELQYIAAKEAAKTNPKITRVPAFVLESAKEQKFAIAQWDALYGTTYQRVQQRVETSTTPMAIIAPPVEIKPEPKAATKKTSKKAAAVAVAEPKVETLTEAQLEELTAPDPQPVLTMAEAIEEDVQKVIEGLKSFSDRQLASSYLNKVCKKKLELCQVADGLSIPTKDKTVVQLKLAIVNAVFKPETQPEPKAEPKPEPKAEPKAEPKSEDQAIEFDTTIKVVSASKLINHGSGFATSTVKKSAIELKASGLTINPVPVIVRDTKKDGMLEVIGNAFALEASLEAGFTGIMVMVVSNPSSRLATVARDLSRDKALKA